MRTIIVWFIAVPKTRPDAARFRWTAAFPFGHLDTRQLTAPVCGLLCRAGAVWRVSAALTFQFRFEYSVCRNWVLPAVLCLVQLRPIRDDRIGLRGSFRTHAGFPK